LNSDLIADGTSGPSRIAAARRAADSLRNVEETILTLAAKPARNDIGKAEARAI